jgi:hypothetical protein
MRQHVRAPCTWEEKCDGAGRRVRGVTWATARRAKVRGGWWCEVGGAWYEVGARCEVGGAHEEKPPPPPPALAASMSVSRASDANAALPPLQRVPTSAKSTEQPALRTAARTAYLNARGGREARVMSAAVRATAPTPPSALVTALAAALAACQGE